MTEITRPAPAWLDRALAIPGRSATADIAGNRIHYLEWGSRDQPGLLLVHGFRAHAHWWDGIAPLLAENFHVVAMDLSGMGDSGHRPAYGPALFAEEIAGVIAHARLRDATLIGHSFGGLMSIAACHAFPQRIARAIIIDSRVSFPDDDVRRRGPELRPQKRYPDIATALRHFRLVPAQEGVEPALFEHIARHSVREDGGAWVWKFDSDYTVADAPVLALSEGEMLARAAMPIDFICGEHSAIVTPALAQRVGRALVHGRGPIVIPDAGHHILLDQPLALTAVLRALLA